MADDGASGGIETGEGQSFQWGPEKARELFPGYWLPGVPATGRELGSPAPDPGWMPSSGPHQELGLLIASVLAN